jgi:hypothetical protein
MDSGRREPQGVMVLHYFQNTMEFVKSDVRDRKSKRKRASRGNSQRFFTFFHGLNGSLSMTVMSLSCKVNVAA